MNSSLFYWLGLTLLCISIQSFYSMMEMACVSFNKVRLHYYASKGQRRAAWLSYLLAHPSRLFGTTLVAINVALQIGSECSRQFYQAANLSPHYAPISQVFLVLIFAELAPMFAARKYSENVAMLGMPVLYFTSKLFTPLIYFISILSTAANRLVGGHNPVGQSLLSRDEVQRLLELAGDGVDQRNSFDLVVSNIFSLRDKSARQIMEPLSTQKMIPSSSMVGHMREILKGAYYPYLLIFHQSPRNIQGIIFPRDVLEVSDKDPISSYARTPWFITEDTPVFEILQQFRRNHQSVAVVLNPKGKAWGILTLDDVLEEIFGDFRIKRARRSKFENISTKMIERTFSGTTTVEEFCSQLDIYVDAEEQETLSQMMTRMLGHLPEAGEVLRIGNLELKVEGTTVLGAKTISVRSVS